MFRMEYPEASRISGSDIGKDYNQYNKKNSAGNYSKSVERKYTERKESGEGSDPHNNPYPLKK